MKIIQIDRKNKKYDTLYTELNPSLFWGIIEVAAIEVGH